MYQVSQEQMDDIFRRWINGERHRLDILQLEGFSKSEAIEMLKISKLQGIQEAIHNSY